jgi:hypothetical protein
MRNLSWSLVILLASVTHHAGRGSGDLATAQAVDMRSLQRAQEDLGASFDKAKKTTERFLKEGRDTEGPCIGYYRELPSESYLIASDALSQFEELSKLLSQLFIQLGPALDVEQELKAKKRGLGQLTSQLQVSMQELSTVNSRVDDSRRVFVQLQRGQQDTVRGWMDSHYGTRVGPAATIEAGSQIIVIQNTLFGTLITAYPHELSPSDIEQTTVKFTPAIFADELFPTQMEIGPSGYSSKIPEDRLILKPARVSGPSWTENFQLGIRKQVSFASPVEWTWTTEATEQFKGASFSILMEAAQSGGGGNPTKLVAQLPVRIDRKPERSFLEKYGQLLGGGLAGSVLILSLDLARSYCKKWKEKRETRIIEP